MTKHSSGTIRMNVTLPLDVGQRLKSRNNRSAFIAQSLREKFAREEQEKLDRILAKAYKDSAEEDQQINEDWDVTSGDGL